MVRSQLKWFGYLEGVPHIRFDFTLLDHISHSLNSNVMSMKNTIWLMYYYFWRTKLGCSLAGSDQSLSSFYLFNCQIQAQFYPMDLKIFFSKPFPVCKVFWLLVAYGCAFEHSNKPIPSLCSYQPSKSGLGPTHGLKTHSKSRPMCAVLAHPMNSTNQNPWLQVDHTFARWILTKWDLF